LSRKKLDIIESILNLIFGIVHMPRLLGIALGGRCVQHVEAHVGDLRHLVDRWDTPLKEGA